LPVLAAADITWRSDVMADGDDNLAIRAWQAGWLGWLRFAAKPRAGELR